jgi:hypothetical protein
MEHIMAGRKPAPPDKRLSARVEIRMTEAQAAKLERLGKANKQTGSDWLRDRIDRAHEPARTESAPPALPWKA